MTNRIYCVFGYECNNNCLLCAVDAEGRRNHSLSTTNVLGFLDKLGSVKNTEMEISGGEPTCRPELFYFLESLCTNYPHIRYILLTNGRNFSKAGLAAQLADLNPFSILIPVHGDAPALHDTITQVPGSFNETLHGIHNLYDYGLRVGLKTIVNGMNYKRLPHLVEFAAQNFFECKNFSINGLDIQGKALINIDRIGVKLSDAVPYIEKALDIASSYGMNIKTYSVPPCLLDEDHRKFSGEKQRSTVIAKTPTTDMERVGLTYGTVDKCRSCRYFSGCTGTWRTYFDIYGTDEIKPIE